ncbi:MAG TPA: NAD(P)-dependent oxidoreductase [Magnetococcales bacterium]|nr:NAD(P)-dependent oxidoreductase [Magnetococcales bacterium]
MKHIGFVGLGIMGRAMALNAARAGFAVTVFNRSRDKTIPFADQGIPVADTIQALATDCEAIVVMVTGPEALDEVVHALTQAQLTNKVIINCSTVSLTATQAAGEAIERAGGAFLDAPVSGSKIPAETAKLVFLVGSDAHTLQRCHPLLSSLGSTILHCGPIGDGTRMKLAVNLMLANTIHALSETLVFAEKIGLQRQAVANAINSGVMASPLLKMKSDAMLNRDFSPHFPLDLVFKDLNLILDEAGKKGAALPATSAVRESFNSAMAHGWGREDIGAVLQVLELKSGLKS